MHDIGFAQEIIDAIRKKSGSKKDKKKVISVNVSLSPFSHVKPEGLKETFLELSMGSGFEGIELNIQTLKVKIFCRECKNEFFIDCPSFSCPVCKSQDMDIKLDKEFFVESLEIEQE